VCLVLFSGAQQIINALTTRMTVRFSA
jgi:hypothetical protein